MKILAIDVGIKNLSYCLITANRPQVDKDLVIDKWENLCITETNCKNAKIEDLTKSMLLQLLETFDSDLEIDIVAIENQPMLKNGVMKTMSVVIYTYFNLLSIMYGNIKDVRFISATNKLKCKKAVKYTKDIKSYKERKSIGIDVIKEYLQDIDPSRLEWFGKQSKSDDLADCALFAIYIVETSKSNAF